MVHLFTELDKRRRKLGMSYAVLSQRSQVSMPTVVRILSGRHAQASFANVFAIAKVLGVNLQLGEAVPVDQLREQQARRKAKQLIKMLQGTSGLEAQALSPDTLNRLTEQTVQELMAGSKRNLWSE